MGKQIGMGFDDFGRLSDMNDDGVTMAMADPLSFVGPSATPAQRVDLAIDAGARKQGGSYDPNTRTVTMPDKSGQRKPQGGKVADGVTMSHVDPTVTVEGGYQPSVEIDRKFTGRRMLPDGTIVSDSEASVHMNDAISKARRSAKGMFRKEDEDAIRKSYKSEQSETLVSRNEWTGDHEASILAPVATLNIGTNFDSQTHREKRPGARDFLVEHGNEAQRQFATGNLREQMHIRSDKEGFADAVNSNAAAGISTGNMGVDRKNSFATMEKRDATTPSGESIVVAPNPEMVKTQYAKPSRPKKK